MYARRGGIVPARSTHAVQRSAGSPASMGSGQAPTARRLCGSGDGPCGRTRRAAATGVRPGVVRAVGGVRARRLRCPRPGAVLERKGAVVEPQRLPGCSADARDLRVVVGDAQSGLTEEALADDPSVEGLAEDDPREGGGEQVLGARPLPRCADLGRARLPALYLDCDGSKFTAARRG